MNIYEHSKHGFHIISPGDDVALMESAGWFKSTHPSTRHEKTIETQQEPAKAEEVLKPKRGRPAKVKD